MANGVQTVFVEESDDDFDTDTTQEEYDPDKEYDVECVLTEAVDANNKTWFLIKWEKYPLHDCTWETKDSITHEIILRQWEAEKRLIKAGEKEKFDLDEYEEAFDKHQEKMKQKKRARLKKRRQRGEVVDDDSGDDDDDDDSGYELPTTATPKRSRSKVVSPPVKKKGTAQPVTKKRTLSKGSLTENGGPHASQFSEFDSLFDEPMEIDTVAAPKPSETAEAAPPTSDTRRTVSTSNSTSTITSSYKGTASTTKALQAQTTAQIKQSPAAATPITTSARKSAPVGKAKPASKSSVFADWTKPKGKQGRRVPKASETLKDSNDRQFSHLSHQYKVQQWGRNERPPDPNFLVTVDPKTGARAPFNVAPIRTGQEDIHSAYCRRSPPRARQRTPSPPASPVRRRPSEAQVIAEPASALEQTLPSTYDAGNAGRLSKTLVTCRLWKEGVCKYPSDRCRYVHADITNVIPKKQVTCYYWSRSGNCKYSADECNFCHYITDEIAGQPGTYIKKPRATGANDVPVADVSQMHTASPIQQFFTPSSSVDQYGAATFAQPPPPPPLPPQGLPHVQPAGEPRVISAEPSTDPRLKGRAPQVSDSNNVAPKYLPNLSSAMDQRKPSISNITGEVEMTDAVDVSHGSLEQDLAVAKRDIVNLDPTRLLTMIGSDKRPVQNVYIHMPDRPGELELLEKYFRGLERKVYTSNAISAWNYFRHTSVPNKDSLLIVHPTEMFAGTLPGLSKLLVTWGSGFSVFSVGVQHARCIRENRKPKFEAQRLFPHGGMTFITDSVFAYCPDKATQIINNFIKDTEQKPAKFHQMSKIAARPGIKNWLMRLVTKKMEEQAGNDAVIPYVNVYDAICRLCPLEDEDPASPDQHIPLETSFLFSPSAKSLPSFQGKWESGDEESATDQMAEFFAGEACAKAWKYSKFHFVYQWPGSETVEMDSQGAQEVRVEADPKGWGLKYSHVGVVTPDQFLKKRNV